LGIAKYLAGEKSEEEKPNRHKILGKPSWVDVVGRTDKECEVVPFNITLGIAKYKPNSEVVPFNRTLGSAKYKPNSTLKKREQFMRLRNKNEILPSRNNYLCTASEGDINSTEGGSYKGRGATEREDRPTDQFSRLSGITKCKQNHTVKNK
jgi:hypothetical protein